MRQVFRQLPWIHPQIDQRIQQFFNQYGRYLRLKQGASIFNGGDTGEIALVLSGLGVFSFPDRLFDGRCGRAYARIRERL